MIRVAKCLEGPKSLLIAGNNVHNHQDVQAQLIKDHYGKCYICERICVTDYEIEHLKSSTNNPDLRVSWDNLFLSCRYCNGKKLQNFDNILNPALHNIEEIIQFINLPTTKNVVFNSIDLNNPQILETINFLNRIFNGAGKIRVIKEERFYEYFLGRINHFLLVIDTYLTDKSDENRNILIEELGIDQEFLAFKYHILKQRNDLFEEFEKYMIWNRI